MADTNRTVLLERMAAAAHLGDLPRARRQNGSEVLPYRVEGRAGLAIATSEKVFAIARRALETARVIVAWVVNRCGVCGVLPRNQIRFARTSGRLLPPGSLRWVHYHLRQHPRRTANRNRTMGARKRDASRQLASFQKRLTWLS